jgi:hypothetical protein
MKTGTMFRAIVLAACAATPAWGQVSLYLLNGSGEQPAPAVLDLGSVYPSETASARFRIRNTSAAAAPLALLAARGTGFTLTGLPVLPVGLAPQQSLDFSVSFQATGVGAYSASLDTEGTSVLLTATVAAGLTASVETASGAQTLGAAAVDFGSVQLGGAAARHFVLANLTGVVLQAGGIAVQGSGFALAGTAPAGVVFQPGDRAGFDVMFQPAAAGSAAASLVIGDRTYALAGAGLPIPLPRPILDVELQQAQSGSKGTVAVSFDAAAQTSGTGILTLDFQPLANGATDPAIQLGVIGRSLTFPIAVGDAQARFGDLSAVAFQTGTTAGTLTFTASMGGVMDQKKVTIPPAPVAIVAASAARAAGSIEVDITGYDNTRTAGAVVYTFYDAGGIAIAPGIAVDDTANFASYFASSTVGGNFLLRAVFPVSGDASRIVSFEATMTNSVGTAGTGRVKF